MKQKELTVFICDFCRKKMFFEKAMVNHELYCTYNPLNWDACGDCDHCEVINKTIYYDDMSGGVYSEKSKEVKSFKCNALNKTMYPHKAVKIEAKYPESFEDDVLMPNPGKCPSHKSEAFLPF